MARPQAGLRLAGGAALIKHDDPWPARLAAAGLPVDAPLGAGMDGSVYTIAGSDTAIAKVWWRQDRDALERLAAFYADLAGSGLPFATPYVDDVRLVADTLVTVERRLTGCPLPDYTEAVDPPSENALRAVLDVLEALAEVRVTPAMRGLGVFEESRPAYAGDEPFAAMLASLLDRRLAAYGDQLAAAVTDLDRVVATVRAGLADLISLAGLAAAAPVVDRPVHGDLCPPNVLVDDASRPIAVLDWGFLTTAGDPAFDAALASGFFDTYGAHARATDRALTQRVIDRFGYAAETLAVYRAAYALCGANAYSPSGDDGHFDWCVDQLHRTDLRAALGL